MALFALCALLAPMGACKKGTDDTLLNDVVERTNFRSVYAEIGNKVTIADVTERDGIAYVTVDGKAVSRLEEQGKGPHSLEIQGGVGAICLNFEKALKSKAAIIGTITINGINSFIVFLLF